VFDSDFGTGSCSGRDKIASFLILFAEPINSLHFPAAAWAGAVSPPTPVRVRVHMKMIFYSDSTSAMAIRSLRVLPS